jgi:hypothetical protein
LTAAFQHVVSPTLGNRLNPQSEKGTALLSAVKPAESLIAAQRRAPFTKHAALDGAILHLLQWSKT